MEGSFGRILCLVETLRNRWWQRKERTGPGCYLAETLMDLINGNVLLKSPVAQRVRVHRKGAA